MEKNFILFIALSVAVLFSWNMAFPSPKSTEKKPVSSLSQATSSKMLSKTSTTQPGGVPASASAGVPVAAVGQAEQAIQKSNNITVETNNLKITFSDLGAKLLRWQLLKYEQVKGASAPVELIPAKGSGADSKDGYAALHMPMTDFASRRWKLLTPQPEKKGAALRVAFGTTLKGSNFNLPVTKEFLFYPDRYDAEVNISVDNPSSLAMTLQPMTLTWGPGVGNSLLAKDKKYGDKFLAGCLAQTATEKSFEKPGKENEVLVYEKPVWMAQRNQYFVAALINGKGWTQGEIRRSHRLLKGQEHEERLMGIALRTGELKVQPHSSVTLSARLLGSPQEYGFLKTFHNNLQGVVQFTPWKIFRILDPLAIGMHHILYMFHKIIGNWGISLILLTLLVKGLMFYPTMKGMVSMRKMSSRMARMKPRLETIKKMYKDEPTKLNQEMMKLYKEEGVNPLGGCLPMMVQMPIFFALYGTLLGSFELRHAEFFWIWTDLSSAEPYPVLAVLMASSMYLQQRMTPQPSAQMNPEQAKMQKMMMNIMPLMLGGFAIYGGWPSGLLLYWAASNIFSIVQQQVVNRRYPLETPAAPVITGT